MPGHKNWFDINVTLNPVGVRSFFSVTFNQTTPTTIMPFQEAADYTANKIANDYNNLYVGLSGGLDSEFVACVLLRNKIQFTPIIAKFDLAIDEYSYALAWCDKHNIVPVIVELETNDQKLLMFSTNIIKNLNLRVRASFISAYLAKIVSEKNGHLITGEATVTPRTGNTDTDVIGNKFKANHRQFIVDLVFPNQHPSGFLFYTPEILLSTIINLDTSINDPLARTKLYEWVSYRPKTLVWPPPFPIEQYISNNIANQYNLHQFSNIEEQTWNKDELINLLKT